MTYYINPLWFYLMNVSHNLVKFCAILGAILIFCAIVCIIILLEDIHTKEEELVLNKRIKLFFAFGLITVMLSMFLPSKETCIEMMVASQITHENVDATKEEVY